MIFASGTPKAFDAQNQLIGVVQLYFLRALAVAAITLCLVYWAHLSGMTENGIGRFDLLSLEVRAAHSVLAFTLAFASLGLWFVSSWGIVLWLACSILQIAMYTVWSDVFGERPIGVALIVAILLIIAVLMTLSFLETRKRYLQGF
ncbi:MAG: DUF6163 family protein [Pseudomonadota bacterium]